MRLDPKYFNLFIAICAGLTVLIIVWATIRHQQGRQENFRENLENVNLNEHQLAFVTGEDSVRLGDLQGPVLIDFWATWSGKSQNVHKTLHEISASHPRLRVLAAAVRDDEERVLEYMRVQPYDFTWVAGTTFYHALQVPGVPSHILIDGSGRIVDYQVGEDNEALTRKIEELMRHEQP